MRQLSPQQIGVVTVDSDDPSVNTSLERRWTIVPHWSGKAPVLNLPSIVGGVQQPALAPSTQTARRSILIDAEGVERLAGFTTRRDHRAMQALISGQDYSGAGVPGVGQRAVRAGLLGASFNVPWSPANKAGLLQALLQDLAPLWQRSPADRTRRSSLGLSQLASAITIDDFLLDRLINGFIALTDINAPTYDAAADQSTRPAKPQHATTPPRATTCRTRRGCFRRSRRHPARTGRPDQRATTTAGSRTRSARAATTSRAGRCSSKEAGLPTRRTALSSTGANSRGPHPQEAPSALGAQDPPARTRPERAGRGYSAHPASATACSRSTRRPRCLHFGISSAGYADRALSSQHPHRRRHRGHLGHGYHSQRFVVGHGSNRRCCQRW